MDDGVQLHLCPSPQIPEERRIHGEEHSQADANQTEAGQTEVQTGGSNRGSTRDFLNKVHSGRAHSGPSATPKDKSPLEKYQNRTNKAQGSETLSQDDQSALKRLLQEIEV